MERTRTRAFDDPLQRAFDEVSLALAPLPEGYFVEIKDKGIVVGCHFPEPDGLGFAITAETIRDDRHINEAVKSFPELVKLVHEAGGPLDGQETSEQ